MATKPVAHIEPALWEYSHLRELWDGMCDQFFLAPREEMVISSMTHVFFDITVSAESMHYELDVAKDLWMTKGRFTTLQNDYIDPPALRQFIDQSSNVSWQRPQISQMMCRVKGKRHVSYNWGNCILGFTFRAHPRPVFSVMSRTSMITRMGGLDLALSYLIAKEIAEGRGDKVDDYGFRWYLSSAQHSSLQGVPYFYSSGWMDELKGMKDEEVEKLPALRAMKKQLEYFDDLDARNVDSKLGTRKRIREQRKYFEEHGKHVDKVVPVPLSDLTLDPIKKKWEDEDAEL